MQLRVTHATIILWRSVTLSLFSSKLQEYEIPAEYPESTKPEEKKEMEWTCCFTIMCQTEVGPRLIKLLLLQ